MATLKIQNLVKRSGSFTAVDNLDLDVAEGEFVVLLGPSGCGKTTTLKMISGFIEADSGKILIGPKDITRLPPYRRNLGVVFQNYALFPHMSVYENVAFPLRRRRSNKSEIDLQVVEALRLVQLDHLASRLPKELSGGQQQRVAIARALSFKPEVLLLDEPLSNLDAKLRLEVREQIRQLQRKLGITTVMVTHDQEEAMSVADRLVVMKSGVVQQIGSSRDVYQRPFNQFVASFIGSANFLEGGIRDGMFWTTDDVAFPGSHLPKSTRRAVLRPEAIILSPVGDSGLARPTATVEEVVYLGAHSEIALRITPNLRLIVRQQNDMSRDSSQEPCRPGQTVNYEIGTAAIQPISD